MNEKNFNVKRHFYLIFGLMVVAFAFQANLKVYGNSNLLNGSYQIDFTKSANIQSLVQQTSRQHKLISSHTMDLQTKLNPPEMVEITVAGSQVVLSSSDSTPTTLNANNQWQTFIAESGTKVSVRTALIGNSLEISSVYDKTQFTITFRSMNEGKNLRVTRMVRTDYLNQSVFADSVYDRIGSNTSFSTNSNDFRDDGFIVPNGTVLAGMLENQISTKFSQNNDRFQLTVESPSEYKGAVIEGYVTDIERSNGVLGTAKVTLNFQKIRLANGRTYEFAGIIQSINEIEETAVKRTNESQLKGKNKTKETVKRGILAAGAGAIIGGIIGGTKGAFLGAAIGGAGGPATLLLEKDHNITLKKGLQINVQSTSPTT